MKWMLLMFLMLGTVFPLKAAQQYNEATCILLKHEIAREKRKRGNNASVYYSQSQKRFDTHCKNPIVVQQKKVSTPIIRQANKPIATQVKAPPIYIKPKPLVTKTEPRIDRQTRKSPPMASSTPLLPLFVLLMIGLTLLYSIKKKLPQIKGKIGESLVKKGLEKHLDSDKYTILNDVTLPLEDGGTTQIDHIVVSNFGIFVIETKNMSGWIFGSERQSQWTQTIHRSKYQFQNPLRQNYKHTKTLSMLLDVPHNKFHSVESTSLL